MRLSAEKHAPMIPPNAAPRLRDVIEEEITQGVFRPGDRLDELALARR